MSALSQQPAAAVSTSRPAGARTGLWPAVRVLVAVAVAAVAWSVAVSVATDQVRAAVSWSAGVAGAVVVAVVAAADWRLRRAERQRQHLQSARDRSEGELHTMRAELEVYGTQLLPWVRERVREKASAATILDEAEAESRMPVSPQVRQLVVDSVQALYEERRRLTAAVSVLQDCAHRVQAAVTDQQAEIDRRKQPYWEETSSLVSRTAVRADFQVLDERLANMELLARRMTALAGARRIGRPWPKPIEVERVLRAAVGAAHDYRRVELALPRTTVAVVGSAVNAVIQVMAEIIDNGLRFSDPTTRVRIEAEEVPAGMVLHVDDSGLVMAPERIERARRIVDLDVPLDLANLSGNRLGLASARVAAQRCGIRITFGTSPSGGTRADILLPQQWLTRAYAAAPAPAAASAPAAAPAPTPAAGTATATASAERAAPEVPSPAADTAPSGAGTAPTSAPSASSAPSSAPPSESSSGLSPTPSTAPAAGSVGAAPAADPTPPAPSATSASSTPSARATSAASAGLPKRTRGATLSDGPSTSRADDSTAPARDAQETGTRLSVFRDVARGAPPPTSPPEPSSHDSSTSEADR